jgi:hypothetical protein
VVVSQMHNPIILSILVITILSVFLLGTINYAFGVEFSDHISEKYGIQFQYPSHWEIKEKTSRFDEGTEISIRGSIIYGEVINIQYGDDLENNFGSSDLETALLAGFQDIKNSAVRQDVNVIEAPSYTTIDNQKTGTYLITMKEKYDDDAIKIASQLWEVFVGNHGYLISFTSIASTFDSPENIEFRDHFIKSIKFLNGQQSSGITSEGLSTNENPCNPISGSIPLKGNIIPKGVIVLGAIDDICKLKDGVVTLNIPNKNDIKFVVLHIDKITNSHQGAIIEMDQTEEKSSKSNKISKVTLTKEMSGTDPKTDEPIEISKINGFALFNVGKKSIPFNSQNKVNLKINLQ